MKGYFLGNTDIELYAPLQEFQDLKNLKKEIKLELEDVHHLYGLDDKRKMLLLYEDIRGLSDGIQVKLFLNKKNFYRISFNDRVLQFLEEQGVWGTRYGLDAKIIFYTKQSPWERIPKISKQ